MTRKEAIKIVQSATVWTDDEREALGILIPELRESEEEQALHIIRKRMRYDPAPISDEDRRIVEDWLEKKQEQKPVEWSEEDEDRIEHIVGSLESLKAYIRENAGMSEEYKGHMFRRLEQEQSWLRDLHS